MSSNENNSPEFWAHTELAHALNGLLHNKAELDSFDLNDVQLKFKPCTSEDCTSMFISFAILMNEFRI